MENIEYRGWLLTVKDELLRKKNPQPIVRIHVMFCIFGGKKKNPKETSALMSRFMQGKGSMLSREKETTTVPFGKDLMGFLLLLAEQQSKWTQESFIDLLSYKYSLHTVMNSASVIVLSLGLKGEEERSLNSWV